MACEFKRRFFNRCEFYRQSGTLKIPIGSQPQSARQLNKYLKPSTNYIYIYTYIYTYTRVYIYIWYYRVLHFATQCVYMFHMYLRRNRTDWLVLITDKRCVYSAVRAVSLSTVCPTRYQTRDFFNNCKTNEDIAKNLKRSTFFVWEMKRNVSVLCVSSAPNCCDKVKLLKKCRVL